MCEVYFVKTRTAKMCIASAYTHRGYTFCINLTQVYTDRCGICVYIFFMQIYNTTDFTQTAVGALTVTMRPKYIQQIRMSEHTHLSNTMCCCQATMTGESQWSIPNQRSHCICVPGISKSKNQEVNFGSM